MESPNKTIKAKEDAKKVIEEIKKLELQIDKLKCQSVSDMTLVQLYDKLIRLFVLNAKHRRLSEKEKMLLRLVPRSKED